MAQWKSIITQAGAPKWVHHLDKHVQNAASMYQNNTGNGVFGVTALEVTANPGLGHTGWVKRTIGTGGRAGRVSYEVLVAQGAIKLANGVSEDSTVLYDITVTVKVPGTIKANTGTATTISANVSVKPSTGTFGVIWQANTGAGFAPLVVNAVYTSVTGNTLAIANTTGLNGVQYKAVVTPVGHGQVKTSAAAVLTVT